MKDVQPGFVSFFNTPDYRLVLGLGNTGFGFQKRFGFRIDMRNQNSYYYESDFRQGEIDGFTTLDAQVSYKFTATRSILKLGATNLTNKYYQTGFGNPQIGGIYYLSFGYNVF
ncbi:MAG: TonB-dependent receptor [Chitinophagaceae bacterium]|nr:MAG: TonB-dependent receptor [Chitinophagaceae bacterium]